MNVSRLRKIRTEGFSPVQFRAICWFALVLLGIIVVSGGLVRLTGSGLGCNDWPNCNGTHVVDLGSKHSAIEQVNRLFTFLVCVGVALAAAAISGLYAPDNPHARSFVKKLFDDRQDAPDADATY